MKFPPYTSNFQTFLALLLFFQTKSFQKHNMKLTRAKVIWLRKVGMLEAQEPQRLPTKCSKTVLRPLSGGPLQEVLETPCATATEHQDIYTGTNGKACVSSIGSPYFETMRLQLCRWAFCRQHCLHHSYQSSHVGYCHLVTFRNLMVLKALIWNKRLCQHFCSEFLFSMIYNEAYF